jgi:hypothetical protein
LNTSAIGQTAIGHVDQELFLTRLHDKCSGNTTQYRFFKTREGKSCDIVPLSAMHCCGYPEPILIDKIVQQVLQKAATICTYFFSRNH